MSLCNACNKLKKIRAKGLCGKCYQRKFREDHPDWDSIVWQRMKADPRKELLKAARRRAIYRHRPFKITLDDIIIPKMCPILGIPLYRAKKTPTENYPSLDEIVVGRGYVPGNIQVISRKANTMKSNATPRELKRFAQWITAHYAD